MGTFHRTAVFIAQTAVVLCSSSELYATDNGNHSVHPPTANTTPAPSASAAMPGSEPTPGGSDTATPCTDDPSGMYRCMISPTLIFDKKVGTQAFFDIDTGWLPASSPLQLDFHLRAPWSTHVHLEGALKVLWTSGNAPSESIASTSGLIEFDMGLDAIPKVKIDGPHLNPPIPFMWEGPIPILGKYGNLHTQGSQQMDHWEPGKSTQAKGNHSTTLPVPIPISAAIIPIPLISGGLIIGIDFWTDATYSTERLVVSPSHSDPMGAGGSLQTAAVDMTGSIANNAASSSSIDYRVHPEGIVHYETHVGLHPGFYIQLGPGFFYQMTPFELTIPLPAREDKWVFEDQNVHVPLPKIQLPTPSTLDFGNVVPGQQQARTVKIHNTGEAPAHLRLSTKDGVFQVLGYTKLKLQPGAEATVTVQFSPTNADPSASEMLVVSNDPHVPTSSVHLIANGATVQPPTDPSSSSQEDPNANHSSGCSYGPRSYPHRSTPWFLIVVVFSLASSRFQAHAFFSTTWRRLRSSC